MIVSFAWTTKALLAGRKRCTRRMWNDEYFDRWVYAWRAGRRVHDAYDRQPRFNGHKIGEIRLTCEPYREKLADMPDSDLIEEGGLWENKEQFIELFGSPDLMPVVIRFEFTPLNGKKS